MMSSGADASLGVAFSVVQLDLPKPTWDDSDGHASLFDDQQYAASAVLDWGFAAAPSGPLLFSSDLPPLDARRIAHLRFENGDVVVKLSPRPGDSLLLHRSAIGPAMPLLSPYLRKRWTTGQTIQHPQTGEAVEVFTLSLKHVEGTLLLAGEVSLQDALCSEEHLPTPTHDFLPFRNDPSIAPFPSSVFIEPGWPLKKRNACSPLSSCLDEIAEAHLAIFGTIYSDAGQSVPALQSMLFPRQQHFGVWNAADHLNNDVPFLSLLLAYATYYGCERLMRQRIFDTLSSFAHLPQAMSLKPISWLRLGKKMQSRAIYFDALRHLLAGQRYSWRIVALELGLHAQQAERIFLPRLRECKVAEQGLFDDLYELAIVKPERWFSGEARDGVNVNTETPEGDAQRLADDTKADPKHDAMARRAYGDWLFKMKKHGQRQHERAWESSKESCTAINLSAIYAVIMDIETPLQPNATFDEEAAELASIIFGTDGMATQAVQDRVANIIRDARRTIYLAYRTKTEQRDYGKTLTYRCSTSSNLQTAASAGMPYIGLDEEEIPWAVLQAREPSRSGAGAEFAGGAGKVCFEQASRKWLRACGLAVQGEETVEEIMEDVLIMSW